MLGAVMHARTGVRAAVISEGDTARAIHRYFCNVLLGTIQLGALPLLRWWTRFALDNIYVAILQNDHKHFEQIFCKCRHCCIVYIVHTCTKPTVFFPPNRNRVFPVMAGDRWL